MSLLHGYDVSGYNSSTVPSCDFVFVKATEGSSYTSSRFPAQWASAKSRAKIRGAYCFARPEDSSANSQADRFLARVDPVPGEMLCLDLEASGLNQSKTNAWARAFGDRLREKATGVTTVLYLGSGYASNGTGKCLSDHFDWWWYPQYPSAYQLVDDLDIELHLAQKRSSLHPERMPIAASTTAWPSSVSPWLPSGITTGWDRPHLWQFTDNWNGMDASVSALTLDQLAGGGLSPLEDDMPYGGQLPAGAGTKINISFPHGAEKAIGLVYDSPDKAKVRVAFHYKAGKGEVYELEVGGPKSADDSWPAKTVQSFKKPADGDWVSLTRLDDGTDPVGWDMS